MIFRILLILAILLVNSAAGFLADFLDKRFRLKEEAYLEEQLFRKYALLEYRHFENEEEQRLMKRVSREMTEHFTNGYARILQMLRMILQTFSFLIVIQAHVWWAGIVVIFISLPLLLLAFRNGEEDYEAFEEAEDQRRYADYYAELLSEREYVRERRLFAWFDKIHGKWEEKYETARKIEFSAQIKIFFRTTGAGIATTIMSLVVAAVLLPAVLNQSINPGIYISLVISSFSLVRQISWELTVLMQELTKDALYLEDYQTFFAFSEYPALKNEIREIPADRTAGVERIEFINVSFAYPSSERKILNGLSFILEGGRQYALVGENAAGKTTIIKLLTGLYDQYSGEIRINGKDLREYSQEEKQALFSIVYQDFAKYQISAAENISIGRKGDWEKAVEQAGMKEVLDKLPQREKTRLGKLREGDQWLSGGEWQRIALARGFYTDAPIRILDEPTAAIDPIQEAEFFRLFQNKPIGEHSIGLLITHRLGGAKRAGHILFLKDGKVAEQGSHDELWNRRGEYYAMYERQRSWYES